VARPRQRFTRPRFVAIALVMGLIGQIPGAILLGLGLGPRIGGWAWAVAWGACLVALLPLGARLWIGSDRAETGGLGVALRVFFAWWGTSVIAALAAPFAWAVAWAAGATAWAPWIALGAGAIAGIGGTTVWRTMPRLRRLEVAIEGLPPGLDGYRIAQMSDLHMGPHTPPERVRRWVDRVNRLSADLVAVTGDLITQGDDYLDALGQELGRLRGRDGVAVCMGNHDYFADHERLIEALEREGIEVLRNRGRLVERGEVRYFLAGVDDTWTRRADVHRALAERPDETPTPMITVMLAHDPALFDECADKGAHLVLSGHTHGGQVAVPIFGRTLNLARLGYRYIAGHYRRAAAHGVAQLYVSRGAGTTGPPLRIGAPSEIALITLRAAGESS
jgi:uncharacterized protein